MKKFIAIVAISIIAAHVLTAQDPLPRYLETAALNNPGLMAKFSEYLAALEKIPQVGTIPDPKIAFGYFIQPVETRNGPQRMVFSLNQMFPWFGLPGAKKDVAASHAKVKYQSFEAYKSKLFFEVKVTYYKLYFINKGIDIAYDNIRILESFRNLALVKIEAGKASGIDEIRIEMEIAELENKLALLKDRYNLQVVKFNNLLNVDENSEIIIPENLHNVDLVYSRQAILDSLRQNNPEVRKLDFLKDSYREQEHLAKKTGAPSINLGIDYIAIGETDNPMPGIDNGKDAIIFPKIGITIPLYRKKYSAMINEAVHMQEAVDGQKAEKVNGLEILFEQSYNEYLDASRRIELYQKQNKLADMALNILKTEYASKGRNFEELLRMERRLLGYALELQRAYTDKQASIAFIDYLMGN